ncbi:MAG: hypothetical protein HRU50_02360 [Winogradskyella sp.]|uniref:hypothetical protein n=1 Tax=Winogradskyella sp. TaxID=1883156 RepID=UPI0025D1B04C|nr:hypothetical protein [Winogradskyella sp.]NRB58764.1 hypothetical protein [Winogradskyella sp.]
MKTIKILMLCLITSYGFAQKKLSKTSQSIKVNKDVVVDLNTSYAEIEIDTWNKDIIEIEAYVESDKLSKEELQRVLDAWNLKVDGSNDRVEISSEGGKAISLYGTEGYTYLLKDLEFELADLPEIPEINFPDNVVIGYAGMPEFPEMPDMPEFPELPELPDGITTIKFDYDKYQKEGDKYLKEWSKRYEKEGGKELQKNMEEWAKRFAESGYQEKMEKWGEEYGKRFEGKWAKDMEKWGEEFGEKFGKDMEKWGEEFGEKFSKEWAEKMEAWGERLGAEMERKAELMERKAEMMERRAEKQERMAERQERLAERQAERAESLERRKKEMQERRAATGYSFRAGESGTNSKVRKVIKIKIPKKAKLKTNIRHGELKLSSVIHNLRGDISHAFLIAENIDGSDTSINVSYSPVVINTWNLGTLNLNYVDKAQIRAAKDLVLNSKSSNVNIESLSETGIIDGSFGDLTISNLTETFKNLNLILENSDALVNLPKGVNYTMHFKGNKSKLNNRATSQKTIRGEGQSLGGNIIVNAKYSSVIMN